MGERFLLLASATMTLRLLGCQLPESESFGANDATGGLAAADTGGASTAGAAGAGDLPTSGGALLGAPGGAGAEGGRAEGGSAEGGSTGGRRAEGGIGGRLGEGGAAPAGAGGAFLGGAGGAIGGAGGAIGGAGGAIGGGAGGEGGEPCNFDYCLSLADGLAEANVCSTALADYVLPDCGTTLSGDCFGRHTIRTVRNAFWGDFVDCYYVSGALVGFAYATDHGTWVAGEVTATPYDCTELVVEDIPECQTLSVTSPDGIDCPAHLPDVGAACPVSGRCDYTSELACSSTCTAQATHRMRCVDASWTDAGLVEASCEACESENASSCGAAPLEGHLCAGLGDVCTYATALNCPTGCSGGDLFQEACVDGIWYNILRTAGAPECVCP